MPFQKGNSGNPHGRPRRGDSLAEAIRQYGRKEGKKRMVGRMWDLASKPHDRPDVAIRAAEWVARHGWPDEAKGEMVLTTDPERPPTIVHEHREA